jgi:hypothetical protein
MAVKRKATSAVRLGQIRGPKAGSGDIETDERPRLLSFLRKRESSTPHSFPVLLDSRFSRE